MKLSQIRRRIELCMKEIIFRPEMNLQNLLFAWRNYSYSYSQASTEVLSYRAEEILGNQQSTSKGLHPGAKMQNWYDTNFDAPDAHFD
jgi:hypothetical protein